QFPIPPGSHDVHSLQRALGFIVRISLAVPESHPVLIRGPEPADPAVIFPDGGVRMLRFPVIENIFQDREVGLVFPVEGSPAFPAAIIREHPGQAFPEFFHGNGITVCPDGVILHQRPEHFTLVEPVMPGECPADVFGGIVCHLISFLSPSSIFLLLCSFSPARKNSTATTTAIPATGSCHSGSANASPAMTSQMTPKMIISR